MNFRKMTALSIFFALLACGGNRVHLDQNSNVVKKEGVMSVWADWVKDKGGKFDLRLNIKNESETGAIIMLNGMTCHRGNTPGVIKHTFFNTGERTIDFRAGELKSFNLVCKIGAASTGDFRVGIDKVFDNPSNDGKTTGKVIAEKLEWKQSDSTTAAK